MPNVQIQSDLPFSSTEAEDKSSLVVHGVPTEGHLYEDMVSSYLGTVANQMSLCFTFKLSGYEHYISLSLDQTVLVQEVGSSESVCWSGAELKQSLEVGEKVRLTARYQRDRTWNVQLVEVTASLERRAIENFVKNELIKRFTEEIDGR